MALLQVTPDMMRQTQQAIETALEHATVVANQYLSSHENLGVAWQGSGYQSSVNTAMKVQRDLAQATTWGAKLAQGLGQVALMMEQHEMDAAHSFAGFAGDAGTSA
jgi:ESAT-6 family protein